MPWEYANWIGIVQRAESFTDFLAILGTPTTPDTPATGDDFMLYSRLRNALDEAKGEYEERCADRLKNSN